MWPPLPRPRFSADIEQEFQASYYARVRPTLRLVSGALASTWVVYMLLGTRQTTPFIGLFNTPYLVFCLLLFGLTYMPSFARVWQGVIVVLAWISSGAMLFWVASLLAASPVPQADIRGGSVILNLFFLIQTCVLMVAMAALRLQFKPALALQSGVVVTGLGLVLYVLPLDQNAWDSALRFVEPVFLVLLGVLLASFIQEQLARNGFDSNRRLAILQAQEHQKRIETERMLHILNGAIGGIVHDLGNPLTGVQTGSELLESLLRDGDNDQETLLELNKLVLRSAKMLSFLRLSLIEQSRVLEGKPVPVELKPVSVRAVVEAGASFQKPRFSHGHTLSLEEQDHTICADEMKMVTVLMNLIGNALKYSEGQVRVTWRAQDDLLILAVLDEGMAGRGLTKEQGSRLFVPFGRLETHAGIEGTGLGLLSVQKIVEAHGGEVWIEGFEDGTHNSPCFSTARGSHAPMLCPPFRTAFVLTCPLAAKIEG